MIELSDAQRELLYSKDEFTVEEAAEILGCSIYTVRRKIKEGAMSADGGTGRGGYRIPYMSINLYIAMVNGDMSAIYDTDSKEAAQLAAVLEIVPRSVHLLEWLTAQVDYADDPVAVQATLKTCEAELALLKNYYNVFLATKPNPRNWGKLLEEAQALIDRAGEVIAHVRLQISIVEKRAERRNAQTAESLPRGAERRAGSVLERRGSDVKKEASCDGKNLSGRARGAAVIPRQRGRESGLPSAANAR